MPDPEKRHRLKDPDTIMEAHALARENMRQLRIVTDDNYRDAIIVEDTNSGDRRSVPNKLVRALGAAAAFEMINPDMTADADTA